MQRDYSIESEEHRFISKSIQVMSLVLSIHQRKLRLQNQLPLPLIVSHFSLVLQFSTPSQTFQPLIVYFISLVVTLRKTPYSLSYEQLNLQA